MSSWKTTVIVSTSLQNHEALWMILSQQHRLRFSDSVEHGALVFPLSGTAFMLITPEEFPEKSESSKFFNRIEKFVQVHRNSFLLLQSPVYGAREWEIVSTVQKRFFGSNLKVLPLHSNVDIVKALLTIAKATSKPLVDSIRERMALARAQIIERSPVWEVLGHMQLQ
ncbi:protein SPO16 homolog [Astyanax mexicanus]|uniref:protein SPO16 homolog n=1 Tax=Astyanax mexicanus TaxID=7994 RepID=UPI0020CADFD8|nr:protein SPO16 homolog [Astyanax mexicanus]